MKGEREKTENERLREFALIWERAGSVSEVCEKTGMSPREASKLAHDLRANNVPLKTFRRGPARRDYAGIAELVMSLKGKD